MTTPEIPESADNSQTPDTSTAESSDTKVKGKPFSAERIDYKRALTSIIKDPAALHKMGIAAALTAVAAVASFAGGPIGSIAPLLILTPLNGYLALVTRGEARATSQETIPTVLPSLKSLDVKDLAILGFKVSILMAALGQFGKLGENVYNTISISMLNSSMAAYQNTEMLAGLVATTGIIAFAAAMCQFLFSIYSQLAFARCADKGFIASLDCLQIVNITTRTGMGAAAVITLIGWTATAGFKSLENLMHLVQAIPIHLHILNGLLDLAANISVFLLAAGAYGVAMFVLFSIANNLAGQLYRRALSRPSP